MSTTMSTTNSAETSTTNPAETPTNGRQEKQRKLVEESKRSLERLGQEVRQDVKSPLTGAAVAGAALVGAALMFGVPEALLGAAAGLVVYRMLKSKCEPAKAPAPRG
jgi:hypothetical protein